MFLDCASIPAFDAGSLDAATAADAGIADTGPDAVSSSRTHYVFVTHEATVGAVGRALDGGPLAPEDMALTLDALCENAWLGARREKRSFRALVWAAANLSPFHDIKGVIGGWFRVEGNLAPIAQVFASEEQLRTSLPSAPIVNDEYGNAVDGGVWTGGNQTAGSKENCASWQSNAQGLSGQTGNPATSASAWIDNGAAPCSSPRRIYCLEID